MTRLRILSFGIGALRVTVSMLIATTVRLDAILSSAPQRPTPTPALTPARASTLFVPVEDAWPILAAHLHDEPGALFGLTEPKARALWPAWIRSHDIATRERLARGDEDSIVNLWLFGTTFTSLPRVTREDVAASGRMMSAEDLLLGRLRNLLAGITHPKDNERLSFARAVVMAHSIDLATAHGQEKARDYLIGLRERVLRANQEYQETVASTKGKADQLDVYAGLY